MCRILATVDRDQGANKNLKNYFCWWMISVYGSTKDPCMRKMWVCKMCKAGCLWTTYYTVCKMCVCTTLSRDNTQSHILLVIDPDFWAHARMAKEMRDCELWCVVRKTLVLIIILLLCSTLSAPMHFHSRRTDVSYFTVLVLQCIHTPILDDTLNVTKTNDSSEWYP